MIFKSKKFLFSLGASLLVLVVLSSAWIHRYYLFDTIRLAGYDPSPRAVELAELSGMSPKAERMYIAAHPSILAEEEFDSECNFEELGLVLGCYSDQNIYVLDVQEERLEKVEIVTAAHEMLHVVYGRLTDGETLDMIKLLDRQLDQTTNPRIIESIDAYRDDPEADLYNEMHSIFATEYDALIPELETYYAQFFSDRSKVIAASEAYEEVFLEFESAIEAFDKRLSVLAKDVSDLEALALVSNGQIAVQRGELNSLLEAGRNSEYNARLSTFNALVVDHNNRVGVIQDKIAEYNTILAERNSNVAAKNNLIKSLDSDIEAIN